jgi:hypothetical protein
VLPGEGVSQAKCDRLRENGPKRSAVSPKPDNTADDLQRTIVGLRQELARIKAERDEGTGPSRRQRRGPWRHQLVAG